MIRLTLALAVLGGAKENFWKSWDDYKAELSGYRLTQPRYGEARSGDAVLVFVMEPFSKSKLIKPDHPDPKSADVVQVLKLNELRRFVTGVYDYSLMTSVFVPIAFGGPPGANSPLKVAFSSQEWCGVVYEELRKTDGGYQSLWHSYFESEGSGSDKIAVSDDAVLEDELLIRLRELFGPMPAGRFPFVAGLATQRLSHGHEVVGTITVKRGATERITVPAGAFDTTRWELSLEWGPFKQSRRVWVETAGSKRIIAWEGQRAGFGQNEPVDERAELTGSIRNTYWQHHAVVDEPLREQLGLSPSHL